MSGLFAAVPLACAGNSVVAWGAGMIVKQSGNNDFGQSIVPADLTKAVYVAAGWRHSLAVNGNGTLQGWGDDTLGQTDFPSASNYVAVGCGSLFTVALLTNVTLATAGAISTARGNYRLV